MANSANLPAPFLGVNEKDPIAAVKSPYCESLINFNVTTAGIELRKGDSKFDWISPAASGSDSLNMGFFPYGDTKLISPVKSTGTGFIDFYDCETGVSGLTTINSLSTTAFSTVYFAGYLFFFPNTSTLAPGFFWNGSAYGTAGYTGSGNFWPIGGNAYKNRIYLIQLNEAAYWYPTGSVGINAISGACTKIDLTGLTEQSCTLSSIASFTLSDQTSTQEYQSFIMSNGEVLFYEGSYPDSPTWRQVGKAKVGQPLYSGSTIRYQGDTLLMCDSGVISLRALFLAGSENAENLSANKNMQNSWRRLIQGIRLTLNNPVGPINPGLTNGTIRGIYDPKSDRIIISFPFRLNRDTGVVTARSFYFVFYTPLQAWFFHESEGDRIDDICVYKNGVRLLAQTINQSTGDLELMTYTKEGSSNYQDRNSADTADVSYNFEMISAPVPFPKTAVYEATFIEPILESDLYDTTLWYFVADFGRQTSTEQTTNAATTSVAKPGVNVGMQNITYVQVQILGVTAAAKTVGLYLYSYNVWYDSGDKASR